MYLDLCRTSWRFVRTVTLSAARPSRYSQTVPPMVKTKQASISSFFKPKTSNSQTSNDAAATPKTGKAKKSPPRVDNKENVNKMIKNIDIKSDESDDDIVQPRKGRRAKIIDSSDEEETAKPARKKQKLEQKSIKEEAASSSSDSDDDDFESQNSDGDKSSGSGMDSDLADELAWLKDDQTEEEQQVVVKKKKKATKTAKKKKGFRAETDEDECPFSEVESQSPVKQSPKKRGRPKKSPDSSPIKMSPKAKVEPTSPVKKISTPVKKASSPVKKATVKKESSPVRKESPSKSPIKKTIVKPGEYDPTLAKYDPITDACWKRGEAVPYHALARTLESCEENSGRLAKTEYLANFFRSVIELNRDEIVSAIHMPLNLLAAAYEGVELGIGDMILIKSISQATGRPNSKIKADMVAAGDLGIVAQNSKGSQKVMFQPKPLKMDQVYAKLQQIASISGTSSGIKKVELIKGLLVACKGSEARYFYSTTFIITHPN